jgi:type IV pilus assembly protein PilN
MSLDGVAQSNSSVAEYMRNIEASPWMGHADLRKTENTHDDSRMPYSFGLDVKLNTPSADAPASSSTVATPPAPGATPAVPAPLANAATAVTGTPAAASTPGAAKPASVATPAGGKP